MINGKRIAAALAVAGLAAAGAVVAADKPQERGCEAGQHAADQEHEHGMQRMREMHARMGEMRGRKHGGQQGSEQGGKQEAKKPQAEEEHKH